MIDIFGYMNEPFVAAFMARGSIPKPGEHQLVEMFHGTTGVNTQADITERFSKKDGPPCVVATVAFGMGVHVPDVDFVLHWGPYFTHVSGQLIAAS